MVFGANERDVLIASGKMLPAFAVEQHIAHTDVRVSSRASMPVRHATISIASSLDKRVVGPSAMSPSTDPHYFSRNQTITSDMLRSTPMVILQPIIRSVTPFLIVEPLI